MHVDNMNIEETLSEFQEDLKRNGLSQNTIISYLCAVRHFFSAFSNLSVKTLQSYRESLMNYYSPSTVNTRISAMNRFLTFLYRQQDFSRPSDFPVPDCPSSLPPGCISVSETDPFPRSYQLPAVRTQQKSYLDSIISQTDYERLKNGLLSDHNMDWYFLVHFLGSTGIRVGELIQIKLEHLQLGYMDLYSKGGKVRRIYFPDKLCQKAIPWYTAAGKTSGFLFTNKNGKPLTPRWINLHLKELAVRYGINPDTVYPHSFRHRFAKNFLNKCSDISLLADLLGHESIETTRIYLTKSTAEQREVIDKIVTW